MTKVVTDIRFPYIMNINFRYITIRRENSELSRKRLGRGNFERSFCINDPPLATMFESKNFRSPTKLAI